MTDKTIIILFHVSDERLENFEISTSEIFQHGGFDLFNVIATQLGQLGAGETRNIPTSSRPGGRYVMIRMRGKGTLVLCEVEVYGNKTQGMDNFLFKASSPFVQTFCIEKDSYMDAI